MRLNRNRNKEAASTLTEVLCAASILAICAAGLMGAMANGFFTIQLARENQRATQILMQEAEMIRLYNWDQVNKPGFIPGHFSAVYDPQSAGGGGLVYTGTVEITPIPSSIFTASYATNMRQLTLNLTWRSKDITRTRSLTTLVSKDGLQNYVY